MRYGCVGFDAHAIGALANPLMQPHQRMLLSSVTPSSPESGLPRISDPKGFWICRFANFKFSFNVARCGEASLKDEARVFWGQDASFKQ
jgi:hypothetical protein